MESRSRIAVNRAWLILLKQVCDSLVLLVDSELNSFIAINTQPCLYNCKEAEMKANHK